MPNLKPWYRVEGCQPREDLRLNKPLNEADFAVNLDHIRRGESHADYIKPHLFFQRTFMTKSLLSLASGVARRLAGEQSETAAVYNMATQFGGGKTHALALLYHLAHGGPAARAWPGVDSILAEAGIKEIPRADVAVVVGTEFDPITGRQEGDGPVRKTLWGEIAWQLGGGKAFAVVAEHEAKMIAPAGDVIRAMLDRCEHGGPCLILLDELVNYVGRGRKLGLRDQVFDFLQNLSETARARDNVALCVSIPKSLTHEITPEDEEDYNRLKHVLDRLGKAIMMSADDEIAEIIRRRLFEWGGLPKEGELAAQEYAAFVRDNAGAMTGIDPDRAYEEFRASYPFHPAALSVFRRKWQSLPRFQRTRGILRLLALWVARSFQEDHRQQFPDPVIGLGSAPIDDPKFRAAVFEQLGAANLEGPATTDIAGSANAHSVRLDKEATDAIKKGRLHQKAATVVFFESNGGQAKAEATLGEIKAGVGGPGVNLADVDHVLEGLVSSCYYLTMDRNRYRFSVTPNVNKILTDRRAAVQPKQIDDLLRKEIEAAFRTKPKDYEVDLRPFAERSNDVPDRALLTIAVLHPEKASESDGTKAFIEKVIKECGNTSRTFKSALIFVAADSPTAMKNAARDVLAWREIDEDEETKGRLDEGGRRHLAVSLGGAKRSLEDAIWRAYRHVYLLGTKSELRLVDLGIVTKGSTGSPLENLLTRLTSDDVISGAPSPSKLVKWWPPALAAWPTRGVRDAFFSMPELSRLKQPDLIKRTIADGVTNGDFGYARKRVGDKLDLVAFKESLPEASIDISDETVIVSAEDAMRLKEPPRLARLVISPSRVSVQPGAHVPFTVNGEDQYGHPIVCQGVTWAATGGVIGSTGDYKAPADELGTFAVLAKVGEIEQRAEVQIAAAPSKGDEGQKPANASSSGIRWTGEVPPQKWMNFYTKVLSRFSNTPGLVIRVSFEVPDAKDGPAGKADETRSSLKELGLFGELE